MQITGGSSTTWSEFDRYRQAGALARTMLVEAAAQKMGVSRFRMPYGKRGGDRGRQTHQLWPGGRAGSSLPPRTEPVPLRPPGEWKYIGKGVKRLDAPESERWRQIQDGCTVPDLLTAVLAHPPVYGSKVKSFNDSRTRKVPGVRNVVKIPTGVAVIADNFWAAKKGRALLKVEWDRGSNEGVDSPTQLEAYKKLVVSKGLPAAQKGNAKRCPFKSIEGAGSGIYLSLPGTYAHGTGERYCKATKDHCEIGPAPRCLWPNRRQRPCQILRLTARSSQRAYRIPGRRFQRRATPLPAISFLKPYISQKPAEQFIKMVWTREDDIHGAYFRPAFVHKSTCRHRR